MTVGKRGMEFEVLHLHGWHPLFLTDGQPFNIGLPIFRFPGDVKVNTTIGVWFMGHSNNSAAQREPFGSHSDSLMLAGLKVAHIYQ